MAIVDLQKITQDLNRRFSAPLPEFYQRRIIFWCDEDREFEEKIDDLILDNAEILKLTGNNTFAAKKLLAEDNTSSNYLVYSPLRYDRPDDNWLLNIELYSEEFRADLNSIWIDEMGLPSNVNVRRTVKNYNKFFDSAARRKSVAALAKSVATASQLHLAVMSAICGLKEVSAAGIIRTVLSQSLESEANSIYQDFVKYGADKPFWVMVAQATGYSEGDDFDLGRLATHILLTASTRTMLPEFLAGLDGFISTPHQAYCYDLVSDWLSSDEKPTLYNIARFVEQEARLPSRFMKIGIEDLSGTECFPCINECILKQMMQDIEAFIIDVSAINSMVEKRRALAWYDEVSCYYEGLLQIGNMQKFYQEHATGFHLAQTRQIWDAYTTDYYKMDSYYRQFHLCFGRSLTVSNEVLDDPFKHVVEKVEALYKNWYLTELGENWSNVCSDELAQHGHLLDVMQQKRFYPNRISTRDKRVFVIISDALRYEVAASLTEQLRRETQSQISLESVQAIFPTITKFGMAALLPHTRLNVVPKANGGVSVLADNASTEMSNRDKVLKKACANSVALQYKHIIKMRRDERKALVKGMDVVYIYHDRIDEASHTADNLVVSACEEAIVEIKNLVRIICNDFNGTRIYITADHGFLYTSSPLTEDEKVDKTSFNQQDIEYGRRYAIMEKESKPDYLMPVRFVDEEANMDAFTPRGSVRIKMNGGGMNFVHGGVSLQEMVVPVIDFRYLRSDTKAYQRNREKYDTKPVAVELLSATRKISNMIFSLNFYQTEAVADNRAACNYQLYFVDATGKLISDTVRIIADKTSANGQDRTFRCGFNLKSLKYSNRDTYYLVIADESGLQAPQRVEFQIDIAFAIEEFDFFG